MANIKQIALEINDVAQGQELGELQLLRRQINGLRGGTLRVFNVSNKSVNEKEGWAFHSGGGEELQFNIGLEKEQGRFRYGVAFSLETSRSKPDLSPMWPKIELFNEYIRLNLSDFTQFRMWIWSKKLGLLPDTSVRPITSNEMVKGNFIFCGQSSGLDEIDVVSAVESMSKLIPLYRFVEFGSSVRGPDQNRSKCAPFLFTERFRLGGDISLRTGGQDAIDLDLQSNQIKRRLYEQLKKLVKNLKLGDEIPSGNGGKIDVVSQLPNGCYDFYEIKPAVLAKHAIREALPQLLEYAYRRGGIDVNLISRLVIVSQARIDKDEESSEFLSILRAKGIPIYYLQIDIGPS